MPLPTHIICVLFDSFEPLDLVGPLELWGYLDPATRFIYAARQAGTPVTARTGNLSVCLPVVATHSFDELLRPSGSNNAAAPAGSPAAPAVDWGSTWLLVPGGIGTRGLVPKGPGDEHSPEVAFIQEAARRAALVTSVCTGAALLAAAGVLAARRATSNKRAWQWVTTGYNGTEGVRWVRAARWVRDENVVTSSGVSAGMDMAWGVVRDEVGLEAANEIAGRAEYEPHTDPEWDPFAEKSA